MKNIIIMFTVVSFMSLYGADGSAGGKYRASKLVKVDGRHTYPAIETFAELMSEYTKSDELHDPLPWPVVQAAKTCMEEGCVDARIFLIHLFSWRPYLFEPCMHGSLEEQSKRVSHAFEMVKSMYKKTEEEQNRIVYDFKDASLKALERSRPFIFGKYLFQDKD